MSTGRGLNKKRGLESLIPHKIDSQEDQVQDKEEKKETTEIQRTKERQSKEVNKKTEQKQIKTGVSAPNESMSADQKSDLSLNDEENNNEILSVRLTQVIPNQDQPRKDFRDDAIRELADSIRQYGVIQPLLVQKKGKYYEIIAGERRWRAAKEAGLKDIPVILKKFDKQETMEISLIENIQRENLNAIEEAEAFQKLINTFQMTQEEVAEKVGKSRSAITNSLRLLKLAKPVQHLLLTEEISMGHARALLAIEDEEEQIRAAHQVIQKKLSVRETENLVKNIIKPRKSRKKEEMDTQTALAYKSIEENLQKLVGSKVSIKPRGDKGKIEIEYYSQEELERIIDLIG
ncbi:MAG: ParB/RepB/Spo0J family partition protein [Bilifractor sp.]